MCLRVCVCVCLYIRMYVCTCGYVQYLSVHTSECVHLSMYRAIATLFLFKVILRSSQWRIFHSAANEIVLHRMGAYNCDEKNKQLVNEIYDMFVYLIFWNCWIHFNNKWDFLSKLSQENDCIPDKLGKGSVNYIASNLRRKQHDCIFGFFFFFKLRIFLTMSVQTLKIDHKAPELWFSSRK